jgi:hypothetical protein
VTLSDFLEPVCFYLSVYHSVLEVEDSGTAQIISHYLSLFILKSRNTSSVCCKDFVHNIITPNKIK